MKWYQILVIILLVIHVTVLLIEHDEPLEGEFNMFTAIVNAAIWVGLLHAGGFWK